MFGWLMYVKDYVQLLVGILMDDIWLGLKSLITLLIFNVRFHTDDTKPNPRVNDQCMVNNLPTFTTMISTK